MDFKDLSKLKYALPHAMKNQNMSMVIETMKDDCEKNKGIVIFRVVGVVILAIAALGSYCLIAKMDFDMLLSGMSNNKKQGGSYYK